MSWRFRHGNLAVRIPPCHDELRRQYGIDVFAESYRVQFAFDNFQSRSALFDPDHDGEDFFGRATIGHYDRTDTPNPNNISGEIPRSSWAAGLKDITDGSSNTICMGEVRAWCSDALGYWTQGGGGGWADSELYCGLPRHRQSTIQPALVKTGTPWTQRLRFLAGMFPPGTPRWALSHCTSVVLISCSAMVPFDS